MLFYGNWGRKHTFLVKGLHFGFAWWYNVHVDFCIVDKSYLLVDYIMLIM